MRNGFTMIELLVVIVIIAILAAILFPVFAKAQKARQMTCVSNQRQIAMAEQIYTGQRLVIRGYRAGHQRECHVLAVGPGTADRDVEVYGCRHGALVQYGRRCHRHELAAHQHGLPF